MRKLVLIAGLAMFSSGLLAQIPMGAPANGKSQSAPNMGHIYGKIVDKDDKPVSDVSVVLLQPKFDTATKKTRDILLQGLVTKSNGEFSFDNLPMFGPLKLKVSASGYKPYEQTVSFQLNMAGMQRPAATSNNQSPDMSAITKIANAFDKDLGNIKLTTDVQ